ncbi:MAG: pyrimidine dimer DNA glycosylase/endonuclease V [Candidatus Micrarchaeaceae archaeon]
MRIWDIEVSALCMRHLLGEHRELHATWSIITNNKKGYSSHPEVKRWRGKLAALYKRHESLVREMKRRGFEHNSPLDKSLATGSEKQDRFVDTVEEQKLILKKKGCLCKV